MLVTCSLQQTFTISGCYVSSSKAYQVGGAHHLCQALIMQAVLNHLLQHSVQWITSMYYVHVAALSTFQWFNYVHVLLCMQYDNYVILSWFQPPLYCGVVSVFNPRDTGVLIIWVRPVMQGVQIWHWWQCIGKLVILERVHVFSSRMNTCSTQANYVYTYHLNPATFLPFHSSKW